MAVPDELAGKTQQLHVEQHSLGSCGLRKGATFAQPRRASLRSHANGCPPPAGTRTKCGVDEGDRNTESRIPINAAVRPRLSLLVMGEQGVFTYPLPDEGVLRIGRAEHCDITLGDTQLSRDHAELLVGAALEIVDLGSSNGTRIDGRPLAPHVATPLPPGNVVTMGTTVLVVQHASAEARDTPALEPRLLRSPARRGMRARRAAQDDLRDPAGTARRGPSRRAFPSQPVGEREPGPCRRQLRARAIRGAPHRREPRQGGWAVEALVAQLACEGDRPR